MMQDNGMQKLFLTGWLVILLGLGSILGWALTARLESAAIAFGVVEPISGVRPVQHLEGGIVREVKVANGDRVKRGQPLLLLDDTQARAQFKRLDQRLDLARIEQHRLSLENAGAAWSIEPPLDDSRYAAYLPAQEKLFNSRNDAYSIQLDIMDQKVLELQNEGKGLSEQKKSAEKQIQIINGQLKDLKGLEKKNLVSKTDRLKLESALADYRGKAGKLEADMARVEQRIGETQLNRVRLERTHLEKITNEMEENQKLIIDLEERLKAAADILERTTIVAEIDGVVTDLQVKTAGEVLSEGGALLKIVPADEQMIIRARINPDDIDVVTAGLEVDIRLTAFSMRRTKPLHGKVLDVSADRRESRDGESYYEARVSIDMATLPANLELYSGMSAQLAIISGENTVWEYLLNPVLDSMERSLREN